MQRKENVFRGKSIERVSSPEKLNDYIRVSGPGLWVILIVLILILVGFLVWSVFYQAEEELTVPLLVSNGVGEAFLDPDVTTDMLKNAVLVIGQQEYPILRKDIGKIESRVYIDSKYINGNTVFPGDEVCKVSFDVPLADGCYLVKFSGGKYYPASIALN